MSPQARVQMNNWWLFPEAMTHRRRPAGQETARNPQAADHLSVARFVPIQMKRRGIERCGFRKPGLFALLLRKVPGEIDCLLDDAVWSEPLSQAKFPAIREKYRVFRVFEGDPGAVSPQSPRDHCAF
jgi:hypothetical protein